MDARDYAAPGLHPRAPAIVDAVRTCVGTRFRSQGRVPGLGLDCVGVVLVAAAAAGIGVIAPAPYALGGDHEMDIEDALASAGCQKVEVPLIGDIIIAAPSPLRRHLAVKTPAGVVHAHAGLGRVVEGPLDPTWVITGVWRFPGAR